MSFLRKSAPRSATAENSEWRHPRSKAERASSRNLILLSQRAKPQHLFLEGALRSRAPGSGGDAAFIQNQPSAGRDRSLVSSRGDASRSDASPVRLKALPTPLKALLLAAIAVAGLLCVPSLASADYEQMPEHFGVNSEEAEHGPRSEEAEQLEEALGVAVNQGGEGEVAAGSFYVVGENNRVVRFAPGEDGEEPRFEEAWGWGIAEGGPSSAYVRCGPAYEGTASEAEHTYEHCKKAEAPAAFGGEEVGNFETLMGVAVDQATGYVYVRNYSGARGTGHRRRHLIEVFTARGEPVGEGFGDAADGSTTPPESIAETPEELHRMLPKEGAIAVDEAGTVYLNDSDYIGVEPRKARVMCFRPESAGDYEHYAYCGEGEDIPTALPAPTRIALAGGGRLAVANAVELREYRISGGAQVCGMSVSGQLFAMTANPTTGEVFYYTYSDKSIHRTGPCDTGTETFTELQGAVALKPETRKTYALAVNPSRSWGEARPAGILYAADAENGIGDVLAPAKLALAPEVLSESVAEAGTDSASLRARIDPRGYATTYRFEYLSEAEYQANGESFEGLYAPARVPAAGATIAPGGPTAVSAAAAGLAPDTAYRFRVLAESGCKGEGEPICATAGEAASFATYAPAAAGPPDGRAYELVSPPDKHGGEVFPADARVNSCDYGCKPTGTSSNIVFPMRSAPGGEAVTYMGFAFSPVEGASVFNSYLSRRGASGWQTTAMSPELLRTKSGLHLAYTPDLGADAIYQASPPLAPGVPAGYGDIYLQSASDPAALTPLLTAPPPNRGPGGLALEYAGATPGGSCQLFAANDSLRPGAA